jgi:hypothetical protein
MSMEGASGLVQTRLWEACLGVLIGPESASQADSEHNFSVK